MTKPGKVPGLDARTPLRDAAERLLHARLADVHAAEAVAMRRLGAEEVHDLRVTCRRLRAAIKLFGKKKLRGLDPLVEHLQDALGEVRDLQLQIQWLERHGGKALASRRRAALRKAESHLRMALALWARRSAPRLFRALDDVHARGKLGGARMRKQLRMRLRQFEEALAGARGLEPAPVHELRIAAKKLRYQAELLRDAFDVDDGLQALTRLQDALGNLHDADVRLELVRGDARLTRIARAERARYAAAARRALSRISRLPREMRRAL